MEHLEQRISTKEPIIIVPKFGIRDFPTEVDYLIDPDKATPVSSFLIEWALFTGNERIQEVSLITDDLLFKDLFHAFEQDFLSLKSSWLPKEYIITYLLWKKETLKKVYQDLWDTHAVAIIESVFAIIKMKIHS
jgi:hypothetical protein